VAALSNGMAERERLRETFGEDAVLYDRMRPGYPSALFDDLAAAAGLVPGARVLEIGPGTGQATRPLLERGYRVTAVELSPTMAEVLGERCASYGELLDIHVCSFENFAHAAHAEPFTTIVAATAFHWVDPTVGLRKCAALLHPGGVLATVATHHIEGGDTPFFNGVQACYERWDPATPPGLRLEPSAQIPFDLRNVSDNELFEDPSFTRYEWEQRYTIAAYRDLLMTYSGHRAMPPDDLAGLLSCITALANTQFGGSISKRYMNELRVLRRRQTG
jgi:SAM-dependent methyltransferase